MWKPGTPTLQGIHYTERNRPAAPITRPWDGLTVSTSFHELGELRRGWGALHYAFLSPVFDSISKEGYGAAFEQGALRTALAGATMPIVALGGGVLPYVVCGYAISAVLAHADPLFIPSRATRIHTRCISFIWHNPVTARKCDSFPQEPWLLMQKAPCMLRRRGTWQVGRAQRAGLLWGGDARSGVAGRRPAAGPHGGFEGGRQAVNELSTVLATVERRL